MEDLTAIGAQARAGIVASLQGKGLEVLSEPVIAGMQPDIVARDPSSGKQIIVELKLGRGDTSLSAVGQLTKLRSAIEGMADTQHSDRTIDAFLVTNLAVQSDIQSFADQLNVHIFQVDASPDAIVDSVIQEITSGIEA